MSLGCLVVVESKRKFSKNNRFITKVYKGQIEETPICQIRDNSSIKKSINCN